MASENELKWLDIYIETGDAKQAIRDVFPALNEKYVASRASTLKSKLENQIDERFTKIIKKDSIKALRIIRDLASTAKTESVKLKAAQDILSRAGYDSIQRFENVTPEESYPELINRLQTTFSSLDQDLLSEILGNTEQLKQIQALALGQAGGEQ